MIATGRFRRMLSVPSVGIILGAGLLTEVALPCLLILLSDIFGFYLPDWSIGALIAGPIIATAGMLMLNCVARTGKCQARG